jgi:signal peptidase II
MRFIQKSKKLYLNLFFVFFVFILDRTSKIYILHLSENNFGNDIFSSKYLNIFPIWNKGVSFGLLSFDKMHLYHLLSFLISIIILILIIMAIKNQGFKRLSILMILGGALGNLYDRIRYNGVLDFIDFHVGNFHWFIFNVSDIFITIGVIGMILLELTTNKKKFNEKN